MGKKVGDTYIAISVQCGSDIKNGCELKNYNLVRPSVYDLSISCM